MLWHCCVFTVKKRRLIVAKRPFVSFCILSKAAVNRDAIPRCTLHLPRIHIRAYVANSVLYKKRQAAAWHKIRALQLQTVTHRPDGVSSRDQPSILQRHARLRHLVERATNLDYD
eukprot:TRINITY_DN32026_c0_g1_i1.p1 TRINITY_DN32026_c0_g1~~TRINITY_DN32026_c0_g1_i1.p1  ORF type:complete len:115 (+),score=1.35 TRINITY_DN32026_c0_g1_i1:84-428(+)